uniref:Uncharacterized protein n=1 Tax=Oryza sativa subsp. japonica TaxID=39947 RepID=Q6YTX7_ORYSJ|nr:hypothetical protein [Oryza sativa Japonica Group]
MPLLSPRHFELSRIGVWQSKRAKPFVTSATNPLVRRLPNRIHHGFSILFPFSMQSTLNFSLP